MEEITKDQFERWARFCINDRVISDNDVLTSLTITSDYVVISTNKQSTVFIRYDDNEYILQFSISHDDNIVYRQYMDFEEKIDTYRNALKKINKTLDDVEKCPLDDNICVLLCINVSNKFEFFFKHVDTMHEVTSFVNFNIQNT